MSRPAYFFWSPVGGGLHRLYRMDPNGDALDTGASIFPWSRVWLWKVADWIALEGDDPSKAGARAAVEAIITRIVPEAEFLPDRALAAGEVQP